MNNKVGYLLRTIRHLHVCGSKLGPSFRTAMRTYTLGISRRKSAIQSVNLRRFLLNVPPWRLESSLRLLSQKVPVYSKEDGTVQEQNATKTLLDEHVQSSSSALDPLEEDRSVVEENLVVKSGRSQLQQFFDDLKKCTSPCDVLDLVSKSAISEKHCSNCFTTMWMLTKKLSEDQKHYEKQLMVEHPAFMQLCQRLMQESRSMWCDDLVYSLHAVLKLGVPQNTRLVQTLLRVCQERLNEFDDRCVSVVATTLVTMEKSRNVDVLQAGLQLLVEQRIPKISNIFMLQSMMKCFGKDAPLSLKRKFEDRVLKELDHLTPVNAQHMFSALAAMNYCSMPILDASSNKIIENIPGTPFWQLIRVLKSCSILQYRNVVLYSAIANYVTSAIYMWDTKQIVLFLSAFEGLRFRPVELMDILAEKVTSHPESLNLKDILSVLRVYSLLNHVPKCQNQEFLESLNGALNKYLTRISNVDLLKAVYSFCILEYLPQPALSQLLQEDNLNELLKSDGLNKEQNEMMLHYVNICLELDSPPSFTKPATMFIKKLSSPLVSDLPEVREALLKLLGDERMFQQNIQLPHDYNIDFEIKMDANRKKALPVTEVDDPADAPDIQRVAVLCVPPSAFCFDTRHPRGKLAMKMRHLKVLGYHVILVHYQEFKKLKTEEAIECLKREIYSADAFPVSDVNLQDNV
ncbi:FAST kinase domain-containing protein 2, mitochondrial isoform X1 [Gopherus evgoodei]|uniref:FAST kinase domains 2 n=1 Tax=Gopherus evgoodei TaxID=1825980 RepID=A0A8C4W1Y3_9SAUR|nr:FAST kinase domain-containing protein 2, mitochondrial isoform X1 [Gopherus evgoodei]XP_030436552.1 FAST kinase domain-containing protein 2, mitochondrial isoform X1 [Gopherus evgoodei]XP_030436553.1 FAST kinase domain-containing protein 2, mitochondrial isoform X1 [Gopherus evgoodei]XP_030436554.1 FAST kinase domain-containing protein 2, mitochondrial isoform X1 [Gopherus evgoodei]XP_030436555.1 FAST kinase domain-containing protein 2, mitochondrial isoform X1 [Gopherus evgoodei]XP_0304365